MAWQRRSGDGVRRTWQERKPGFFEGREMFWWMGALRAFLLSMVGLIVWGGAIIGVAKVGTSETSAGGYLDGSRSDGVKAARQVRLGGGEAVEAGMAFGDYAAGDTLTVTQVSAGTLSPAGAGFPTGSCVYEPESGQSVSRETLWEMAGRVYESPAAWQPPTLPQAWPPESWEWPVSVDSLPELRLMTGPGGRLFEVGLGFFVVLLGAMIISMMVREFTAWRSEA